MSRACGAKGSYCYFEKENRLSCHGPVIRAPLAASRRVSNKKVGKVVELFRGKQTKGRGDVETRFPGRPQNRSIMPPRLPYQSIACVTQLPRLPAREEDLGSKSFWSVRVAGAGNRFCSSCLPHEAVAQ
eukprot:1995889-Pleurochrysis_carterae.AAC.1